MFLYYVCQEYTGCYLNMQTRRKAVRESTSNNTRFTRNNVSRESSISNPRSPRASKKTTTLSEKKVADLITSSAKKQKSGNVVCCVLIAEFVEVS